MDRKKGFVNSRTLIPLTFCLSRVKEDEGTMKAKTSDANTSPCLKSHLVQSVNFSVINKFTLELVMNQGRKSVLGKVLPGRRVQLLV